MEKEIQFKIKDFPDLIKVDGVVINTNDSLYQKARSRKKSMERIDNIEKRIAGVESKLDLILEKLLTKTY